ncbi:MAG: hypothetical protein IJJ71_11975 [Treponema sp.]|nr:hypothetical protein [Treponema sp.]MBR0496880.1 hypothetical protein [Treponema sp.]
MNRKNFQDENSCHDMDVANSQKNAKNFFLTKKSGTAMERWRSQPLD